MKKIINPLIYISTIISVAFINTIAYAYPSHALFMVVSNDIEFSIQDANGNISGYTPNGVVYQIPNLTLYKKDVSIDSGEIYRTLEPQVIPAIINQGKYKLLIYGSNVPVITKMYIGIRWDRNLKLYANYDKSNLIYPNRVWSYEFDIPTTMPLNGKIILDKISTPADLIEDLTTAGQLGYIGNAKFVSELAKEINEIETEKAKGKIDDGLTPAQKAKKEYTELLNEITEKYSNSESDEFVKKEAYDVLKEDIEYIINHIQ